MIKQTHKNFGRSDIVNWISSQINIKVEGLQHLGTGEIYCLLINSYFPKTIGETLINLTPHSYHQYVHNLKLFQLALNKLRCGRRIEIDKLSKMKFQQNWQTISWLKRFLEDSKCGKERIKQNSLLAKKSQIPERDHADEEDYREPLTLIASVGNSGKETPLGKASITSTLIQSNYIALIERMKQVVSSGQPENEKIRLLQMLLNLPSKETKEREGKKVIQKQDNKEKQIENTLDFSIQQLKEEP